MSIYVMAPALRAVFPPITGDENRKGCTPQVLKLVCLGLADAANPDGTNAHPGVRNLACYAQVTIDTVVRALSHLRDLGAIVRTEEGSARRADVYTVSLGWLMSRSPEILCSAQQNALRAAQQNGARGPEPRAARGPEPRSSVLPSERPRGAFVSPSESAAADAAPLCDVCGKPVLEPGRWRHKQCPPPPFPITRRTAL